MRPSLLCYSPLTITHDGLMIDNSLSQKELENVYSLIVRSLHSVAISERIKQYGLFNLDEQRKKLMHFLKRKRFGSAFLCFRLYFRIIWNTFDEYLWSLGKKTQI